jgi:hypothetical protein
MAAMAMAMAGAATAGTAAAGEEMVAAVVEMGAAVTEAPLRPYSKLAIRASCPDNHYQPATPQSRICGAT